MLISLLYILLAVAGLSFLIFIHELGHYFMAKRVGMRVEVFSIGFGQPISSWEYDGTRWQIGWLPFGGYVKIAGTDTDSKEDPLQVPGGFFAKSPLDRIKVAFMGPFVNILFAFLAFAALWTLGGREKNFSEFTHRIGWVDSKSELYALGVRPGDEISTYDGVPYKSAKDHLYAPMTTGDEMIVEGYHIDSKSGERLSFKYRIDVYPHPAALNEEIVTSGILQPANYVIYDKLSGNENEISLGSPMKSSGIRYGDRIVWANGELIHSDLQLSHLLNDKRALLTIRREGEVLLRRVPRVPVQDIRPDPDFKEELIDWIYEADLNRRKLQSLYTIPYNLSYNSVVENRLKFIDKESEIAAFPLHPYSGFEEPLIPGDEIIAIDGTPISRSYQLLALLQDFKTNLIVQREPAATEIISWTEADQDYNKHIDFSALALIANSLGTDVPVLSKGSLRLLHPVSPKTMEDLALHPDKQKIVDEQIAQYHEEIETVEDPEKRRAAVALMEKHQKRLMLGLPGVQDRPIIYNPDPTEMFGSVVQEIWTMLSALFSGALSPKWISGPIGIVQVVHQQSLLGIKEAIFWLGAISLNLGILNLLPIPVLDGGTIVMSCFELVSGRRIKPKTMERVVFPFALLLIAFFIFLTFNDLSRIFGQFFSL